MADAPEHAPDPLIAGLPPTLDYFSYLTLLEYQLTPQNLPTLNRLLQEDDGTLAQEIGWELPKLVLPMLTEAPEEATKCLDVIARRGNPREVIVKIAEILETVADDQGRLDDDSAAEAGYDSDEEGRDEDDAREEDELPTFAGEAARIHLGSMVLDGMPQAPSGATTAKGTDPSPVHDSSKGSEKTAALILTSLLSMLGAVHPRIKTQYPSRFLATSLKAALGAYRRVTITEHTTSSFLAFLNKISGKQRPTLPPRVSTRNLPTPPRLESAPLPDPEATGDTSESKTSSSTETAIVQRLLQAVMLELLDEYNLGIQSTEHTSMSWTIRLREAYEPKRVVPGRMTEAERWQADPALSARDALMTRWVRLAKDLSLDVEATLHEKFGEAFTTETDTLVASSNDADENSPSEYPQSPSDIPFSSSAVVMLYAASLYYQNTQAHQPSSSPNIQPPLVFANFWPILNTKQLPTGPEADAILALFYTSLTVNSSTLPSLPADQFTALISSINDFSALSPDASLRDSAHATASRLFHAHPDPAVRLRTARQLLSSTAHQEPAVEEVAPQNAMLQAVVIDWLKDEFLAFLRREKKDDAASASSSQAQAQPQSSAAGPEQGIDPTFLDEDIAFQHTLFPPSLSLPPATSTSTSTSTESPEDSITLLQPRIPAYTSSLNLFTILRAKTALRLEAAEEMVQSLLGPVKMLVARSADADAAPGQLWALEDAVARAVDAMR